MNIVEKKLSEIMPYERNPRNNDAAVDKVAASIEEFGFKVPIVIDAAGVIVCGHTRYKAARKLGMESVPCVLADDLNPYQVAAFRLADNKVAEYSSWDMEALRSELEGLSADIDMSQFGFSSLDEDGLDIESMHEEAPEKKTDMEHLVVCPHCGVEVNLDEAERADED